MSTFDIDVISDPEAGSDDPRRIAIRAGRVTLTRLIRSQETEADDYLRAPPSQLAFWLADNWWRLRWECVPSLGMTPEWRLAHDLSSIGGGLAWPRCSIFGESERIGLISRSDPVGVIGPVRYLSDAVVFVSAISFESAIDQFLDRAADERSGYGSDRAALRATIAALKSERADPAIAEWRRMEARLGFGADDAPDAIMEAMAALSEKYGTASVEEAAMASPGVGAGDILEQEIAAAKDSQVVCNFGHAIEALGTFNYEPTNPPWMSAKQAALNLRSALSLHQKPLRNKLFAELMEIEPDKLRKVSLNGSRLSYGLRLRIADNDKNVIALRSITSCDRRFELARALGDAILSGSDSLGPLAKSTSSRQKFQRAFAQSLLCPIKGLTDYLDTENPTDEDVSAAAEYFHVSERVVQTALVNSHRIGRTQFDEMTKTSVSINEKVNIEASFGDSLEAA